MINKKQSLKINNWQKLIMPITLLCVVLVIGIKYPAFLTQRNLINILKQSSATGLLAIGISFVFFVGGMDLSIAANMGFSGVIGALLLSKGINPIICCIAMITCSTFIGSINGFAVAKLRMIPFIVTLSTMYIADGATVWITGGKSITGIPESFTNVYASKIGIIPLPVIILFLLGIITTSIIRRSYSGRWIYAVGINPNAARVSGIPVDRVKLTMYMLSGLFAGLAAILTIARLGSASASIGPSTLVLDAASSAVVGGVSMNGGIGSPLGAIFGALLITLISNSMNMIGVTYYITLVVKGIIIILFISFENLTKNRNRA